MLSEGDAVLMLNLIYVFEPFEKAIKKFEASKVRTIQHVIPQYK